MNSVMRFSVDKNKLYSVLQHALNFTASKNLSTVLQNVLLEAADGKLTVKATNIQTGFSSTIDADVYAEGSTTVYAKKLSDIVRELPDNEQINFVFDGSQLHIKSGKSSFHLSTMDAELFPKSPTIVPEYAFDANGELLLSLFKKVVFCISNDTSKIEYNGAHVSVFADHIEISAADYQRVAIASGNFEGTFSDEFIVNIPKKTVLDLLKIFEGVEKIHIETDKRQILFSTENITLTSKLIEKYVKSLTRLFQVEYKISALISRIVLSEVVKRISAITSETTHGVLLSFKDNTLTVNSLETEHGLGTEVIDGIEFDGEMIDIIFNARHLLEILANTTSEKVRFAMNSKNQPALILPEDSDAKYLLVPIAIERYN